MEHVSVSSVPHQVAIQHERVGPKWLRQTVVPLFLITVCPPTSLLMWHIHTELGGSLLAFLHECGEKGILRSFLGPWGAHFFGSPTAWTIIGLYAAFELLIMRLLPGARFEGPITPGGNVPVYKANGVAAFVVSMATFAGLSWGAHLFSPSIVYDIFGDIIGALNITALVFCLGGVMFYLLLYRSGIVPRWIAVWGLAAIPFYVAAYLLAMYGVIGPNSTELNLLVITLAVQEMVLAIWMIARGFRPAAAPTTSELRASRLART